MPDETKPPLLAPELPVPVSPQHDQFRFEPLGAEHNERDHQAWMGSLEHVRSTPGFPDGTWPSPMSLEDNLKDLVRHANDFATRKGFTWSILAPDSDQIIGCLYVYPSPSDDHDVDVSSWVIADRAELDVEVWRCVSDWIAKDWPFEKPDYAPRA